MFTPLLMACSTPGFSRIILLCLLRNNVNDVESMSIRPGVIGARLLGSPAFAIPLENTKHIITFRMFFLTPQLIRIIYYSLKVFFCFPYLHIFYGRIVRDFSPPDCSSTDGREPKRNNIIMIAFRLSN